MALQAFRPQSYSPGGYFLHSVQCFLRPALPNGRLSVPFVSVSAVAAGALPGFCRRCPASGHRRPAGVRPSPGWCTPVAWPVYARRPSGRRWGDVHAVTAQSGPAASKTADSSWRAVRRGGSEAPGRGLALGDALENGLDKVPVLGH